MSEPSTLVTRWSHHDYETPIPLVCRYTIEVGDIVDSSHYGKVKVVEVQRTERNYPSDSVQFVFARQDASGQWVAPQYIWTERYPGLSMVPVFEKAA